MYFDNYLNPKPSSYNFNYPNQSALQYNQPILQNNQTPSQNVKGIFQPRLPQNSQNFNIQFTKNQTPQTTNYRQFIQQQGGSSNNGIIDTKGPPKSNNPSFLNTQSSNLTQNQQKKDTLKRRDSNPMGGYFKQNQTHSPSFHSNFIQQNKNPIKPSFNQQSHHNMHSMGRPTMSTNTLVNYDFNTVKDPHRSTIIQSNPYKDFYAEKFNDKSLTYHNMNSSQLKFDHSKHSPKTYAGGFKSKNETFEFETKKNKEIIGYQEKQKKFEGQNKDFSYNFQLKNISSDWNTFLKTSQPGQQSKFFTPSNIKKQSLSDQPSSQIKNNSNKTDQSKENRMGYQKETNQTDRQFGKSPSIDTLLSNGFYKDVHNKMIEKNEVQKANNMTPINQIKHSQFQEKINSENYFDEKIDKKPQTNKNYQALIQNLEKKFSQQKKSSDSFESKQKSYQNELNKKDDKIKRLESIIQNNKQTIVSMEHTIKNFKKSSQLTNNLKGNSQASVYVEQLRQQNNLLKEQLSRQRKKSSSFSNVNFAKDKTENFDKIKQLEKISSQTSKQIQLKQAQIFSLRQSYSTLHQTYKNQFKQHQSVREQLKKIKQNYQEINKNLQTKTQKIQQLNNQLVYLQSKYQGSLEKLLNQNQRFEKQKSLYQNAQKAIKEQKQLLIQSEEKLKSKVQVLQNQLAFKLMQIQNLQQKVTGLSEQESLSKEKLQQNYFISATEQLVKTKQKLKQKQQKIDSLSSELRKKAKFIEQFVSEKQQLLSRIQTFSIKIQQLQNQGKTNKQIKSQQRSKKTSDSVQIKETLSIPEFNDQKQILLNLYHEKYSQIVNIFNLLQKNSQTGVSSMTEMSLQNKTHNDSSPSKQYLTQYHSLITDEIKKIFKDLKKLVLTLKQCQVQSQLKNQRLYQLDKTLKKQGNKIGLLIAQIHMKNAAISQINKMQLEKQIFRLNEKYQILNQINF